MPGMGHTKINKTHTSTFKELPSPLRGMFSSTSLYWTPAVGQALCLLQSWCHMVSSNDIFLGSQNVASGNNKRLAQDNFIYFGNV
jgi:hypothetical protein